MEHAGGPAQLQVTGLCVPTVASLTNKTQCPNCLTVYIITDEQYQKSKGKVRCGTCRQPFVANFLPDPNAPPARTPAEAPRSEMPRSAWSSDKTDAENEGTSSRADSIEPQTDTTAESGGTKSVNPNLLRNSDASGEQSSFKTETKSFFEEPLSSASIQAMLASEPVEVATSSVSYSRGFEDNLKSELSINIEQEQADESEENDSSDTQELIDQVNDLIADKLVDDQPDVGDQIDYSETYSENHYSQDSEMVVLDEPFQLDPKRPRSRLSKWLLTPSLVLVTVLLSAVLIYQLWLRQALPWLENENLTEQSAPLLDPAKKLLKERFDVTIPERRDLANLQLLSARVEPHPSRPSTTLLKVSLLNQSKIAQPFPWLELVLLDENGRLVSRRGLSPFDYLHNNRLSNLLRAQELRPVTIELLAFPRQAHGYELKIINR